MFSGIKRIVYWTVVAALAVLFIDFSIGNRQFIDISLFPFPYLASLPLFLIIMISLAFGIVIGGLTVNLRLAKSRRLWKAEHNRVAALQNEVSVLQAQVHEKPPVLSLK